MNVLVTGSRGFVGERLVKALRREGHSVEEFDIKFGQDVTNFEEVKAAVRGKDVVYHLAAVVQEGSDELYEVNVKGTRNVLEACAKTRVSQFVHLSTAGVMGNITGRANEQTDCNPATRYEDSKAEAEKAVLSYQEILPVTVIRAALVYGNNAYWQAIVKLVKKGFPVIGNGENKWQLIYIKDLVSALKFVLGNKKTIGEVFIVAEREGKTLNELYRTIQRELNLRVKIRHMPVTVARIAAAFSFLRASDGPNLMRDEYIERLVRVRDYDTGKINKLGWVNNYTTGQGIKEMVSEMKNQQLI